MIDGGIVVVVESLPPYETPVLTPRLIVSSATDAIAFHEKVFGAEEVKRYRKAILSLADAHEDCGTRQSYPKARRCS